MAVGQKRKNYI